MSRSFKPFVLSLSKGRPFLNAPRESKGQGFDKLSPNGFLVGGGA